MRSEGNVEKAFSSMILDHDLSTTGNREPLYSESGEFEAATTVEYPADYGLGGRVEQETERWLAAVASAAGTAPEESGTSSSYIERVSFFGQVMGAMLLDGLNAYRRLEPVFDDLHHS